MTPETIRKARQALGLSAPQFCQMLRTSTRRARQTVSEWENDKRSMDATKSALLQAYLDGYRPNDWPAQP